MLSDWTMSDLVVDLGGDWSRPFVCDGDPRRAEVAVIGLNPATPISTSQIPRGEYEALLADRSAFEAQYMKMRRSRGKRRMSPTRKRLGLIRASFGSAPTVETNINATPTPNWSALKRHPDRKQGQDIATRLLRSLRPRVVVLHSAGVPDHLEVARILCRRGQSVQAGQHVTAWPVAEFNGRPVVAVVVPAPSARLKGLTDNVFATLGRQVSSVSP